MSHLGNHCPLKFLDFVFKKSTSFEPYVVKTLEMSRENEKLILDNRNDTMGKV